MILAAGRGERMRPLTDTCPKPLLHAGGKPLIVWHIEQLRDAGFCDIVINHAHLGAMIEARLGDGARFGVRIRYAAESTALETAGGICNALPLLGDDAFLVINGDIFCDANLAQLRTDSAQLGRDADLARLLLVANPPHHPDGDFALDNGRVCANGQPKYTFAGIGVYHPSLFSDLVRGDKYALAPLLRAAMARAQVSGSVHRGYWMDVGTPQRLAQLEHDLGKRNA